MPRINEHYRNLRSSHLFSEIRRRTTAFTDAHPDVRLINVIQKAATSVYTPEDQRQVRALIDGSMGTARTILEALVCAGSIPHGGRNAPCLRGRTPPGLLSWDFFDRVLAAAHVVGVPGSGFGPSGEGYFRLSAYGSREQAEEAVARIASRL